MENAPDLCFHIAFARTILTAIRTAILFYQKRIIKVEAVLKL